MKFCLVLLVIFIGISHCSEVPGDVTLNAFDYGDPCVPAQGCIKEKELQCNNVTLKCECQTGKIYDFYPEHKTCKTPHGGNCWNDEDCVINAYCNADSKCACKQANRGYKITQNGVGRCVLEHGSRCDLKDTENFCDYHEGFQHCDWATKCSCMDSANMVYDPIERKCVTKPGGVCRGPTCPRHRVCDPTSNRCKCDPALGMHEVEGNCWVTMSHPCIENTVSGLCDPDLHLVCGSDNRCVCHPEYFQSGEGSGAKCIGSYKARCVVGGSDCFLEHSQVCNRNSTCDCFYGNQQTYDNETLKCVSNHAGPCDVTPNDDPTKPRQIECDSGMDCIGSNDVGGGICRCKTGWVLFDGKCNHGMSLNPSNLTLLFGAALLLVSKSFFK